MSRFISVAGILFTAAVFSCHASAESHAPAETNVSGWYSTRATPTSPSTDVLFSTPQFNDTLSSSFWTASGLPLDPGTAYNILGTGTGSATADQASKQLHSSASITLSSSNPNPDVYIVGSFQFDVTSSALLWEQHVHVDTGGVAAGTPLIVHFVRPSVSGFLSYSSDLPGLETCQAPGSIYCYLHGNATVSADLMLIPGPTSGSGTEAISFTQAATVNGSDSVSSFLQGGDPSGGSDWAVQLNADEDYALRLRLIAKVDAYGGMGRSASLDSNFIDTLDWGGISGVTLQDGTPVSNWKFVSGSGTDWSTPSPVPEPAEVLMMSAGLLLIFVWRGFDRRGAGPSRDVA